VSPDVERVLVSFGLVLVLEAIAAERTLVLFLGLVGSDAQVAKPLDKLQAEGQGQNSSCDEK
jgi:hypothetical protein